MFQVDVVNRANVKHQVAHTLSRLLTDGTDKTPLEDDLLLMHINTVCDHENDHTSHMIEEFSTTMVHLSSEQNALEAPTWTEVNQAQGGTSFASKPLNN